MEKEFAQLMERHKKMLWRVCSAYGLSGAWETIDAFQEVAVALWKAMPKMGEKECEEAWVYMVATHTMITLYRKQHNRPVDPLPPDLEKRLLTEENGLYKHILELVDLLKETDRYIVQAHFEGYSFKEIGSKLGISEGSASKRYERIIKKIRQLYENGL